MAATVEIVETPAPVTIDEENVTVTLATGAGSGATALTGLTDVAITNPANREGLLYDTATGKWINVDVATQAELNALGVGDFDGSWQWTANPVGGMSGVALTANAAYAARFMAVRSGTFSDFELLIGSTTSGNVDVGLYSFDGTTYTRLWSKGSTACPAAHTWTSMGNPAVAAVRGTVYFAVIAFDNATATPVSVAAYANVGWSQHSAGLTYRRMSWSKTTAFPLPATIAESAVASVALVPMLGMKIT